MSGDALATRPPPTPVVPAAYSTACRVARFEKVFSSLDALPGCAHVSIMRRALLLLLLTALAILITGCTTSTFERQSDLEWQKYNPNYRPLYPDQSGHEWGW